MGCFQPGWCPDGTRIVFTRISAKGTQENIYIVDADGSAAHATHDDSRADHADWGPHPLIP